MEIKLVGRVRLTCSIEAKTGLHIGAGKEAIEIGGIDLPVVKNPFNRQPYIPGSSLKGKTRFLLEWGFGSVREDGRAWGFDNKGGENYADGADPVLRIFGMSGGVNGWRSGPTRLICRDAPMNEAWAADQLRRGNELTEEKTEVSIDRIAGKALDGGLRRTERVPAGAVFDAEFVFRLYDTGDGGRRDRECLAWFIQALDLLEQDALGGSGSRGYGRVRFNDLTLTGLDDQKTGHNLDNKFRNHPFSPKAPAADILAVVEEATASPALPA